MIRCERKTEQSWLTPLPPGAIVRRYSQSVRRYTEAEMHELVRGESRRSVQGHVLPVRYDDGVAVYGD